MYLEDTESKGSYISGCRQGAILQRDWGRVKYIKITSTEIRVKICFNILKFRFGEVCRRTTEPHPTDVSGPSLLCEDLKISFYKNRRSGVSSSTSPTLPMELKPWCTPDSDFKLSFSVSTFYFFVTTKFYKTQILDGSDFY